jgi:hypothetical protein
VTATPVRTGTGAVAEAVAARLDTDGWAGADPYDGLTSPLARLLPGRTARQALTQLVKRSPLDPRPVLGIRPRRMAMTTGLGATACARLDGDGWAARRDRLAAWTLAARITDGPDAGLWGYEFDVQTRWGFYPAASANIVATTFAADGCLDAGLIGAAAGLGRALLDRLGRDGWFAYTPGSGRLIHNGSLLGAALAVRLAGLVTGSLATELREAAGRALATTLAAQRPDGAWPYGEGDGLGWVDGFHTAYVLLRADAVATGLGIDAGEALDKGAACYFGRMFDGGRPRYHLDGPDHTDANNVATGLRAAVWGAATGRAPAALPDRVLDHLLTVYADGEGGFRPSPRARVRWPRWADVPALDALTAYLTR